MSEVPPSWRCVKSPVGHHEMIRFGDLADACKHCGILPRAVLDGEMEPVTPTRAERQAANAPTVPADPWSFRRVQPPKGQTRINRIRACADRDGWGCFYCNYPLVDPSRVGTIGRGQATLDHLLPRVLGGTNVLANLVLACKDCNSRKGAHVLLLAEVIRRQRVKITAVEESLSRAESFIEQLQWEMFDAGLGEIPGRVEIPKSKRRRPQLQRPRPWMTDAADFAELGDRVCANVRAENCGGLHARTAAVIKRGRKLVRPSPQAVAPSASDAFMAAMPRARDRVAPWPEPLTEPIPEWC